MTRRLAILDEFVFFSRNLTISMSPDPVLFIRACPPRAAPHRSCSRPQNQPGIIAGGVGEDTEP